MDEWLLAYSVGKHNKIPFRTTGSSKPKVRITTHTLWPERVLRLGYFPVPFWLRLLLMNHRFHQAIAAGPVSPKPDDLTLTFLKNMVCL